jgi:hypothetical protein
MELLKSTFKNQPIKSWDFFLGQKDFVDWMQSAKNEGDFVLETIRERFPSYLDQNALTFIHAYAVKCRLPRRICVLKAHGNDEEGTWVYQNDFSSEKKVIAVKDFIQENDGKYAAIILSVCNPENRNLECTKSILLFGYGLVGHKHYVNKHAEKMIRPLPVLETVTPYTFEYDTKVLLGEIKVS